MALKPARIELEIGELVLHGFPAADRHRIGEAVRAELERLLAERGAPGGRLETGGSADRLDAGAVRVRPDGGAATGRSIAGAIYGGLTR